MNANSCVELDDKLNSDIMKIVEDHKKLTEKDDFKQIFWEQQVCVATYIIKYVVMI